VQKKQRRFLSFSFRPQNFGVFSLEWFGIFILALFFPRILLTGGFFIAHFAREKQKLLHRKMFFFWRLLFT
jgi:hypothetical protein